MARKSGSLRMDGPYPAPIAPHLVVNNDKKPEQNGNKTLEDGVLTVHNDDGTTTIDFNPQAEDLDDDNDRDDSFDANLAMQMDEAHLGTIASDLIDGLDRDETSRKNWLAMRAQGIALLGLELEKPRSDTGNASAPLEGMSTVRHPLLLEATVNFQATARAELLPASGPCKVRNDTPSGPPKALPSEAPTDPNNPTPSTPPVEDKDDMAQALEKGFNHYLTVTASEYVPDTDRMLFYVGFSGDGFKKVYNCPIRQRPVSESIDAEDLVVSDAATDLDNCGRVTHKIKMRKSVLRRMQILKVYRDVDLAPPAAPPVPNPVKKKKEDISGQTSTYQRPEDRDYEICEIYCELDLKEFAPKHFKGKGLPLPYRVTLEKESRKILDIRRNWKEDDEECKAKQYFVQFPFIRGLGFYGLGYIHLLGNTTIALTAAWRLQLDNGMFANFPGFLYAKGIGRQLSNQFRVPPGGGVGLELGAQQDIRSAVMPLPYKETGPSFSAFSTHVEEVGRRLAATANINVGEGKQEAPVGTTLALIEQATKVMDSAHKRLHASQAKEFMLLKERFKEDPEAFWRFNPTGEQWQKNQFLKALNDYNLVPVADPNNPTSLHRMAKAMAVKELQKASPELYDPVKVDLKISRMADLSLEDVMRPVPATPPPDPRMVAIQEKAKSSEQQNQIQLQEVMIKHQDSQAEIADKQAERASRERIEAMKIQEAQIKLRNEQIIHAHDMQSKRNEMVMDAQAHQQEMQHNALAKAHEIHHQSASNASNIYQEAASHRAKMSREDHAHTAQMHRDEKDHDAQMARDKETHAADLENEKKLAQVKVEMAKKMPKPAKPATSKKPKKDK